jgi:glycosyltransferase involved in cell wall biosynthesis
MPELFVARYGDRRAGVLRVLRWLERRTQRAARYAIGVNDYLRDRIVAAGAAPDRVAVVRNGPVLARVDAARPDPALRAGFRFLCCWSGKMGRQDRVDLLLDAIAELVHRHGRRDCRFVLLGDGECLVDLRAQAARLGLDRWVHFPGWVTEAEVFAHLASADLGLDTSLQAEVSPVKALEYLAFGVPVVAFDLPETLALVRGAGVLVPPGDVHRFATETAALLDDPPRRSALGGAGRRRVVDELCWERQAEVYVAVVGRAAGRAGPPPRQSGGTAPAPGRARYVV